MFIFVLLFDTITYMFVLVNNLLLIKIADDIH